MATNTLHNALCITQNLFKNLRLCIANMNGLFRIHAVDAISGLQLQANDGVIHRPEA